MDVLIRFSNFIFKSETGELIHLDEFQNETISRLQPQPSKLLQLLLENYPNVVSRAQIKESIWPEVHVDFDGSMHFCIRQIRSALNDNATNPKFIETIPRRGYRWISEIKSNEKNGIASKKHPSEIKIKAENKKSNNLPHSTNKLPIKRYGLLGLIGIAFSFLLFHFLSTKSPAKNALPTIPDKIRIAIMPFQPEDEANGFLGNDIAFQLVEKLTNQYRDQFEIIGPTTTLTFNRKEIRKYVNDFNLDCIINGKFSKQKNKSRVLVEIIRTNDGAHVWVKSYDSSIVQDSILRAVQEGLVKHFLAPENAQQILQD